MIVVDTNIISYFYISGNRSHQAEQLLAADTHWNAPILWRSEFRSVLSQYLRRDILKLDEVLIIIQQAEKLMHDNEYEISSAHVMQLVNSSNCSAYDCEFVTLAQYLNVPLITADKKIIREFPKVAMSLDSFLI
ncbi:MAG: type II toxin-antitoxin system VapC family toxin [Gammaproteobacteria bacterium]|nr:type II toxin-antitoxin system VapC family toxin [Gammaproteobacteria bacterium]MCF6362601.1 type II toxin-antitoxin system VapC family toxin [Gammaproteobacteria bacterium]